MADTVKPLPILIIGAGLAGLSLAQSLKARTPGAISFQLFERDDSSSFRAQGYRIRIQDHALRQLLPPHLFDVFNQTCAETLPGVRRINALSGEENPSKLMGAGPPPRASSHSNSATAEPAIPSRNVNVDRAVLRDILLTGLKVASTSSSTNNSVSSDKDDQKDELFFGKKFTHFENLDDEEAVLAHFADDTSYKGRLLIGADGTRSLVRQQLIPEYILLDTEGRGVFGKTIFTPELYNKIPDTISKGGLCLVEEVSDSNVDITSDNNPGKAENNTTSPTKLCTDTMIFRSSPSTQNIPIPQNYIYWVLCFHSSRISPTNPNNETNTSSPPQSPQLVTPPQSKQIHLDLTSTWHPSLQSLLSSSLKSSTSNLTFLTASPASLSPWRTNPRVTIMGDAAHPMTPVGGVGANTAFEDALDLANLIKSGVSTDRLIVYERAMMGRAREKLEWSLDSSRKILGLKSVSELKEWKGWD